MKRLILSTWLALTLTLAPVTALMVGTSGCTMFQKNVAYTTLSGVEVTVDKAMQGYSDAVVAGKVDAGTQAKVRDTYGRYQQAFAGAVAAAQLNLNAPTPADLQSLATNLVAILDAATKK